MYNYMVDVLLGHKERIGNDTLLVQYELKLIGYIDNIPLDKNDKKIVMSYAKN